MTKDRPLPKRILALPQVDLLTSYTSYEYGYGDYYFSIVHYHERYDGILYGYPYSIFLIENPKTGDYEIANYSHEYQISEKISGYATKKEAIAAFNEEIEWIKQRGAKRELEMQ